MDDPLVVQSLYSLQQPIVQVRRVAFEIRSHVDSMLFFFFCQVRRKRLKYEPAAPKAHARPLYRIDAEIYDKKGGKGIGVVGLYLFECIAV